LPRVLQTKPMPSPPAGGVPPGFKSRLASGAVTTIAVAIGTSKDSAVCMACPCLAPGGRLPLRGRQGCKTRGTGPRPLGGSRAGAKRPVGCCLCWRSWPPGGGTVGSSIITGHSSERASLQDGVSQQGLLAKARPSSGGRGASCAQGSEHSARFTWRSGGGEGLRLTLCASMAMTS